MPLDPSIWNDRPFGPDAFSLEGRVALVTGGARGLGRATALGLARCGADVAVCDRDETGLVSLVPEIAAAGRRAHSAVLDVREEQAVAAWVGQAADALGEVDVLVNNAGGGFHSAFLDVNAKGEHALVRENFGTVTACIRAAVPHMKEGASIVNVTSVEAHRAGPGFAIYSAMKSAVESLTKSLALELAPRRIRINCIAPDMIPTGGIDAMADAADPMLPGVAGTPWPEAGHPEDCAAAVVYLASDASRFVTGSTIHLDGGTWAAGGWKRRDDDGFAL